MDTIFNKQLSVIIPVYNEEKNISELVERLSVSLKKDGFLFELVIIDDNSTDKTLRIIRKLSKTFPVVYFLKKGKKGKAYSLKEGFLKARYKNIAFIDADLQYPPEEISKMAVKLHTADIIVANRKTYKDVLLRKTASKVFRKAFGKMLFGLDHDIQAGLKVFKKKVLDIIIVNPSSAWTFDLEFLHRANHAGFIIESHDITFSKRNGGQSKVGIIKTTYEIGTHALKLRLKPIHPVHISPKNNSSMVGAGMGYKKKKYITHTTLPHHQSSVVTFTPVQKLIIWIAVVSVIFGLVLNLMGTLGVVIAVLSFIYFADTVFNLFLVLKSLHFPQEVTVDKNELARLEDKNLPVYTILCPLYKEAHIIPQFVENISHLDWPKEKLDVMLLLEEDDKATIEAAKKMNLPSYIRTIVVPDSQPKTKPKACNYGLSFAKGEHLVIFDAEDMPEADQLKKAYLSFQKVTPDVACLQAKLNYYNPHQNLLTRFFTAEYSLWFDVSLTGLQSINTSIPLGGTSNHFRTKDIISLQGWDSFNVTEDADLGMRLFKKGFKTAIIDSTTLEEANSKWGNWVRQRSRWIKGYMQTYLIHNRDFTKFVKTRKWHALIFQLVIGGKIAFILINPFLWLATISYFTLYAYVGPQIESLYPSVVFYMAVFSLVFGNFLFMYYYMIGAMKRGQYSLIKYVYLVPFYWLMISVAGFIALYQLFFKPFYWEKTLHGLHLKKEKAAISSVIHVPKRHSQLINPSFRYLMEVINSFYSVRAIKWLVKLSLKGLNFVYFNSITVATYIGKTNFKQINLLARIKTKKDSISGKILHLLKSKILYVSGFALVAATMGGNVLNFFFNVYLGRRLSLELFGELSLFTSLLYLASIPLGSYSATISHNIAYLYGKYSEDYARGYLKYIFAKSMLFGVGLSVLWVVLIPHLSSFFQIDTDVPILIFTPIWVISFASSNFSGYLAGTLSFWKKGLLLLTEASTRLIIAFALLALGLSNLVYMSIVLSLTLSFALGWYLIRKGKSVNIPQQYRKFNFLFFITSNLSGISLVAFLTLDVVLVKHFLTPVEAGQYGLLSLLGKMTYFLGSLFGPFMIPLISHNDGAKKDSKNTFKFLLVITLIFSILSFIILGLFGEFFATLIFGGKAKTIVPLLAPYILSMSMFTVSQPIVSYFQAKETYVFAVIGFAVAVFQISLTVLFHKDLAQIVYVMLATSTTNLILIGVLYAFYKKLWIIRSNIRDFIELIIPNKKRINSDNAYLGNNILIFNWRDTKHKWAGGAEVYVHELAKRWVAEGNRVTVFCGNDGFNHRNEIVDGVLVTRRGGFYTVYIWAILYYVFKFRGRYDIVIDSENGIPFFTPLFSAIPVILLIHHVHQEIFIEQMKFPMSYIGKFIEGKLMPFVYKNRLVITVSESSKNEILKVGIANEKNILIINPGINMPDQNYNKTENPTFIYLGRLKPYKNIDIAIKAFKKVVSKMPNSNLLIVGEGESIDDLKNLVKTLEIDSNVEFLGKVEESRKMELLTKSWIALQPSQVEGWGITVLEANACGTPVIASDTNGLRDSINHAKTGLLVKVKDIEGFAKNMEWLANDQEVLGYFSKNAKIWSEQFSWDISAKKFSDAIIFEATNRRMVFSLQRIGSLMARITSLF